MSSEIEVLTEAYLAVWTSIGRERDLFTAKREARDPTMTVHLEKMADLDVATLDLAWRIRKLEEIDELEAGVEEG